jgi:hypothetical protein
MRKDVDEHQRVLVIANVTGRTKKVDTTQHSLPIEVNRAYIDVLTGETLFTDGHAELEPFQVAWILF